MHVLDLGEGPGLLGPAHLEALRAYRVVADHPTLTNEQQAELGSLVYAGRLAGERLADEGDSLGVDEYFALEDNVEAGRDARRVLASHSLRLVLSQANSLSARKPEYEPDLVGVGNVALMDCMNHYTYAPDRPFASFAQVCVRNAMLDWVNNERRRETGMPYEWQKLLYQAEIELQVALDTGQEITLVEALARVGVPEARARDMVRMRRTRTISLNANAHANDPRAAEFGDGLSDQRAEADFDHMLSVVDAGNVWRVARMLWEREKITAKEWQVFHGQFHEGKSQRELANEMGVYQATVWNLSRRVLKRIREVLENPVSITNPVARSEITTATELLLGLGIELQPGVNIRALAGQIIDRAKLTAHRRDTLHALFGTRGTEPLTPTELARQRGVVPGSVFLARRLALAQILQQAKLAQ